MVIEVTHTEPAMLRNRASAEAVLPADPGEVLEVFYTFEDRPRSLLRSPASAPPMQLLPPGVGRFRSDGKTLTLTVLAPIVNYRPGFGLARSSPIDLTSIQRVLGAHAASATLTGLGADLVLVGSGDGVDATTPVIRELPSKPGRAANGAIVIAAMKPATGLPGAAVAFALSCVLGVLCLAGLMIGLARRARL